MRPLPPYMQLWLIYGTLTYARGDVPQPTPPPGLHPLCHNRLVTIDLVDPHDRQMVWAPIALHSTAVNGHRTITGWEEQWACNTCHNTMSLVAASPATPQPACNQCNSYMAWVVDAVAQAAEWRCVRCFRLPFAEPVRQQA